MKSNIGFRLLAFLLVTAMVFTGSNMVFSTEIKAAEADEADWWLKLNGARIYYFNDPAMAEEGIQNTYTDITADIPNLYDKGYRIISLYGLYESDPGDYTFSSSSTYSGLAPIDYYSPESDAGTMEEFEAMVAKADEYGMKIMAWTNLAYSYAKHDYWIKAQEDKRDGIDSPEARSFIWSGTAGSETGIDGWGYSTIALSYYRKNWDHPAFNWASPDWQQEAKRILEFWHEKGIDGWIFDASERIESMLGGSLAIVKEFVGNVCADAGVLVIPEGGQTYPNEAKARNFFGVYDNIGSSVGHDSFNIGTQCISQGRTDRLRIGNTGSSYMTIEQHLAQKGDAMRANGGITFSYDPESGIQDSRRPLEVALMASVGVLYEMYFSRDWDIEGEIGGVPREYSNVSEMEAVFKAVNSTTALEPGGSRTFLNNDKESTVYSIVKTSMDESEKALCIFNFQNAVSTVEVDLTGSDIHLDQTPVNLITGNSADVAIDSDSYTVTMPARSFLLLGVQGANHPPVLDSVGDFDIEEGEQLTFTVSASDPDIGDTLTYTANDLPVGASFDPDTQIFDWTPGYDQAGDYTVSFTVTDDGLGTLSDTIAVDISVADVPLDEMLQNLIDSILANYDPSDYTEASWADLQTELDEAQALLDAGGATDEQLLEAYDELLAARNALVATTPTPPTPPTRSTTRSRSRSGSSGYSGSYGPPMPSQPAQPTPTPLDRTKSLDALNKALASGVSSFRQTNISSAPLSILQELAKTANGKPATFHADSMWENSVDVRVSFDPSKATQDMTLSGSTRSDKAKNMKTRFEKWFKNKTAVVQLDHKGPFGTTVKVAAKVSLAGMNTDNLYFYSYDETAHKYTQIPNPGYYIDKNGYLHFNTPYGGTIIISDGPLEK